MKNSLIRLLKKSDQGAFITHLKLVNKRKDVRNIDLFRRMVSGKEEALKGEIGSNAFNVLKKRLLDRLESFLAAKSLQEDVNEEVQIIKLLIIGRKFLDNQEYKAGFKRLLKAEKLANELHSYSLLNEIYHTLVAYSFHPDSPDQEIIFERFEKNGKQLITQERINMAYAAIRKSYYSSEYTTSSDLSSITENAFKKFGPKDHEYTFETLYNIAHILDIAAHKTKSYHKIDVFFLNNIEALKGGVHDHAGQHKYHIELLYLVANIFFRQKRFNKSLYYLSLLDEQLRKSEDSNYKNIIIQSITLTSLNYNFTGEHTLAEQLLDELFSQNHSKEDLHKAALTRIMIHVQQGEIRTAKRLLSSFQRTDLWYVKNFGIDWLLNKKYLEILIHIELMDFDYADSCINSLLRNYTQQLNLESNQQVIPFLKLVRKTYTQPITISSPEFKNLVEKSINWKPKEEEDIFFMSFYAWLKAKMENRNLYEVTLDLFQ